MVVAMGTIINGRSIPDRILEEIDDVWGKDLPEVEDLVQKLWGIPVIERLATAHERRIAVAIQDYTVELGKNLTADQAKILMHLVPRVNNEPYGAGEVWIDMAEVANVLGKSESHIRRMLIDGKIELPIITRPSSGNVAKKRWILADDLESQAIYPAQDKARRLAEIREKRKVARDEARSRV